MSPLSKKIEVENNALKALIKLSRAADSVERVLGAGLLQAGMTPSQFGALDALYHLGPLTMKTLSGKMLRTNGNLTMVSRNLERKNWIRRLPNPEDGRSSRLEITEEGKAIFRTVFNAHKENACRAFSVLKTDELKTMSRALKKLGLAQRALERKEDKK